MPLYLKTHASKAVGIVYRLLENCPFCWSALKTFQNTNKVTIFIETYTNQIYYFIFLIIISVDSIYQYMRLTS